MINKTRVIEIRQRIRELKINLKNTDYQAIKFAEGELSAEEFEPTKTQRKAWREEINTLEVELADLRAKRREVQK